jgi:16S rRNA pseudouridine516 synthase
MARLFRPDQLLSRFGYCPRREAPAWLQAGRVTIDGVPLVSSDQRIDAAAVRVDGKPVEFPAGLLVAFHKPAGCVCSHDPAEGPLIYDLLPASWMRRRPVPVTVGRLDKDTSGLILISDDGEFVHRWTSPRHDVVKTYEVTVDRDLPDNLAAIFESGTLLLRGESRPCRPAELEATGPRTARLHLREGKYHQVRRMFASQGCTVITLHRIRVGSVELGDLAPGEWREERGFSIRPANPADTG